MKKPEEKELIRDVQQGKAAAQQRLYNRYAPQLYGICLRYARTETEAQDWLQDSFLRIFQDLRQFRGEGSLEGWLRRIAMHTALGHLRKKRLDFSANPESPLVHPADEPSVIDRIQAREIAAMIRQLPSGYRAVFNLYAIEGYLHSEIAEMLGISENTSRSQYARARRALQALLAKSENIRHHE